MVTIKSILGAPSQEEWLMQAAPEQAYWLLKFIDHYRNRNDLAPISQTDQDYQEGTMLINVPEFDHHNGEVIAVVSQSVQWLLHHGLIMQFPGLAYGIYKIPKKGIDLIDISKRENEPVENLISFIEHRKSLPQHEFTAVELLRIFVIGMEATGKSESAFFLSIDNRLALNTSRRSGQYISYISILAAAKKCKARKWLKSKFIGGGEFDRLQITKAGIQQYDESELPQGPRVSAPTTYSEEVIDDFSRNNTSSDYVEKIKIFLSHNSKDKPLARKIADDLAKENIEVWIDELKILVGDSITSSVQQGLEDSNYVVVLLTRHAVESGWVEKEWQSKIGVEATTRQVTVLPVLAEDCKVPYLLKDKKFADVRESYSEGVQHLIKAIKGHDNRNTVENNDSKLEHTITHKEQNSASGSGGEVKSSRRDAELTPWWIRVITLLKAPLLFFALAVFGYKYFGRGSADLSPDTSATETAPVVEKNSTPKVHVPNIFDSDPVRTKYVDDFQVVPSSSRKADRFGYSVGFIDDELVVSAPMRDGEHPDAGKIDIFKFNEITQKWEASQSISSPKNNSCQKKGFGYSVSQNEKYLVSGNPAHNCVLIYEKNSLNEWEFKTILEGPREFGMSVDLDGDYLAVGTTGPKPGKVFLYLRDIVDTSDNPWKPLTELSVGQNSEVDDDFGRAVNIDNGFLAVGATGLSVDGEDKAGAVYIYKIGADNSVKLEEILLEKTSRSHSQFGRSVGIELPHLVVGSKGAVTIFGRDASSATWTEKKLFNTGSRMTESVAVSGREMLIGAPNRVLLLKFDSLKNEWQHRSNLSSSNDPSSSFGYSVAIGDSYYSIGDYSATVESGDSTGSAWAIPKE